MKSMTLILLSFTILVFQGCSTPNKAESNQPINQTELPENKRLSQIISLTTENKFASEVFVIDLGQRIGYLITPSGQIVETLALEVGKVIAKNGHKFDFRPPTGIFYFQQPPKFKSLLNQSFGKSNSTSQFSPNVIDSKIEDFKCQTENCLAIQSKDLARLSKYMKENGLLTIILKKGEWLSEENHLNQQVNLEKFLTSWEKAWESRDINQYISLYAQEFTHPQFNRAKWKKHKKKLFSLYKTIDLSTGKKTILNFGPAFFIQFNQKFSSNSYSDYGLKTLILTAEDNPKIIFEDWSKISEKKTDR